MFRTTYNRGFQMTFENGITISVQFGQGNYCERRAMFTDIYADMDKSNPQIESKTAEVAVWDEDGDWITKKAFFDALNENIDDDVEGWVAPDRVASIIGWCASQ